MPPGRVYLIGAGPGDPGMLTLRGQQCLSRAEVVVYDYLVNPAILEHARDDAELVCRGRHGQGRLLNQAEINQAMTTAALAGRQVARLKGGDPGVFGHLAEEIAALEQAGIPYEIVPGITAALAAASFAGVPLTDREHASALALVTGQERCDRAFNRLDTARLAHFPGTLVYYMGVTTAAEWSSGLIEAGKSPDTPVAVIRRCSWPDQQLWRCRLDEVAGLLDQRRADKIRPPVLVVVGEAARDFARGTWFTDRPLFGKTVLVTRPQDQALALRGPLAELGARVLIQPSIRIGPPADWGPVDASLQAISTFDWVVFASRNGVQHWLGRLRALGGDLRRLGGVRLAAIGPATAEALAEWHLSVDLMPKVHRAEDLADALIEALPSDPTTASPPRLLLVRASRGREVLGERLRAAGAEVQQVVAYGSEDVDQPDEEIAAELADGRIDWVTVTSSAIARNLDRLFGRDLARARLVSISPITTATLTELGHSVAAEATTYTMDGVLAAVLAAETSS